MSDSSPIVPDYVGAWIEESKGSTGKLHSLKMKLAMTPPVENWIHESGFTVGQIKWLYDHQATEVPKCKTCGKPLSDFNCSYCSRECCCRNKDTCESRGKKISEWKKSLSPEEKKEIARKAKETIRKAPSEKVEEWKERARKKIQANWNAKSQEEKDAIRQKRRDAWNAKTDEEKLAIGQKILEAVKARTPEEKRRIAEKQREAIARRTDEEKERLRKRQSEISKRNWERMDPAKKEAKRNATKLYWENLSKEEKDEIVAKREATCIEKYGVRNPFQAEEVKKKIVQTTLERHGVEHILQSDEFKEKSKQTCLEKYGYEYVSQSPEFREQYRKTCQEKWGVDAFTQSKEFHEKLKIHCQEKWGVDNYAQTDEFKSERAISTRWSNWEFNKRILAERKDITLLDTRKDYTDNTLHHYRCERCGKDFWSTFTSPQIVRCIDLCRFRSGRSSGEIEVQQFVESLGCFCIAKDRMILEGKELDIYIPDKHLAIEYNGMWWHRAEKVGKDYHLQKTLACREKGIRLIHIFEWEWLNKKDICQALIRSALGLNSRRIGARKCDIFEISSETYRMFLEEFHLQGPVNSSLRLGLFHDGELLAVAGWGKSRFKQGEMELHRFCIKGGVSIPGALSRLCSHSGLDTFISYVDLAHYSGAGYLKAGFKEAGMSTPGYRWCRGFEVLSRLQTQKHRLPELLGEDFDPELTEAENMELAGWTQAFDCGNLKMIWQKKS